MRAGPHVGALLCVYSALRLNEKSETQGAPPVRPDEDRGRRLIALIRMRRSFNSAVQVRTKEDAVVESSRCRSLKDAGVPSFLIE